MINLQTKTAIAWILSSRQLVLICLEELITTEVLCSKEAGLRLAALAERLRYLATEDHVQPVLEMFAAIGDLDAVDWEEVLDALTVHCIEALFGETSASM
jgi:hypothetical protein